MFHEKSWFGLYKIQKIYCGNSGTKVLGTKVTRNEICLGQNFRGQSSGTKILDDEMSCNPMKVPYSTLIPKLCHIIGPLILLIACYECFFLHRDQKFHDYSQQVLA